MFNIHSGLYSFMKTIMYNGDNNKIKEKSQNNSYAGMILLKI